MSKRQSNLELLRLVSMFLIVLSHCCVHTAWDSPSIGRQIMLGTLSLGEVGVACFVMITGYFSWGMKFRTKSFLKVALQVVFYAYICFVIVGVFAPAGEFSWFDFPLFPILTGEYWFPTTFIALMLFQPAINKLIEALDRVSLKKVIAILTILLVIVPFVIEGQFVYSNLAYFIYLYLFGAYVGKYPNFFDHISLRYLCIGLGLSFLLFCALMSLAILEPDLMSLFDISKKTLLNQNSLPAVLMGAFLMLIFRRINIGTVFFINKLATTVFGIYLISDNPNLRHIIWNWAGNNNYIHSDTFIFLLHIILSVLVIYLVCACLDFARLHLLENSFFKIFDRPIGYISERVDRFMKLSNNPDTKQ